MRQPRVEASRLIDCEPLTINYRGRRETIPRVVCAAMVGLRPAEGFRTNGMGPEKFGDSRAGRWLARLATACIPDRPHGWPLFWAACYHDAAYAAGTTWADRREADANFARNIVTVIAFSRNPPSMPRAFLVATLYWLGVRLGGWAAFNYAPGAAPVKWRHRALERSGLFKGRRGR